MGIGQRVTKLERKRGPQACPACGGGGPVVLRIPAPAVAGPEGVGRVDASPRPGDSCGACGRRLVLRIPSPRPRGA